MTIKNLSNLGGKFMNMYLVPVTEAYGDNYEYFELVAANSPQNAYVKTDHKYEDRYVNGDLETYQQYSCKDGFNISDIDGLLFHKSEKYRVIREYLSNP